VKTESAFSLWPAGARRRIGLARVQAGNSRPMRTMMLIWGSILVAGIAFYAVVGLTHG
jgi:hypothetical protein